MTSLLFYLLYLPVTILFRALFALRNAKEAMHPDTPAALLTQKSEHSWFNRGVRAFWTWWFLPDQASLLLPVPDWITREITSAVLADMVVWPWTVYVDVLQALGIDAKWSHDSFEKNGLFSRLGCALDSSSTSFGQPSGSLLTADGMSWIVNQMDVLDLLRVDNGQYVLDTRFLDDYEYHPGHPRVGGTLDVVWEHGQFRVTRARLISDADACDEPTKYHRLLLGLFEYMTVASHLVGVHESSARITAKNQDHLPLRHPVRELMLPLEPDTINVLAKAYKSLVSKKYGVSTWFPHTFRGIQAWLRAYSATGNVTTRGLHALAARLPLDHPLVRYDALITNFARECIDIVYPTEQDLARDLPIQTWAQSLLEGDQTIAVGKKDVVALVAFEYGQNVRHSRMSDEVVTYVMLKYGTTLEKPTVHQWMRVYFTTIITTLEIRPLTSDFSEIHSNPLVRKRWQQFYRDLLTLPVDNRCPGLLPQNVPGVNAL